MPSPPGRSVFLLHSWRHCYVSHNPFHPAWFHTHPTRCHHSLSTRPCALAGTRTAILNHTSRIRPTITLPQPAPSCGDAWRHQVSPSGPDRCYMAVSGLPAAGARTVRSATGRTLSAAQAARVSRDGQVYMSFHECIRDSVRPPEIMMNICIWATPG